MSAKRPARAADKLVFLLSLVPYLLEQGVVDVSEAAEHFGVGEDDIRDAVKLIATSGLPGETSTYLPNDLFDIDWDAFLDEDVIVIVHHVAIDDTPRLSAREAAALIAGLQYLSALPENVGHAGLGSLMAKLTEGASAAPSRLAVAETESDASLGLIRQAVADGRQVEFDYVNGLGERMRRRADPVHIASLGPDWYVQAYCHLREDFRVFRLDRMSALEITDEAIGDHSDRPALPDTIFRGSPADLNVVVDVAPGALPLIADYRADRGEQPVDGRTRVTLRVAHYHGLKRLISGLPGLVTVVSPPEARTAVADWARAGLRQYA